MVSEQTHLALEGIKVADFTWAAAGPIMTKTLADHGASVVRVESMKHPDSVRFGGPFRDDKPGINKSGFFADFNSSKESLALDMSNPSSREIALDLIGWADIVIESFTPRVMRGWGLGYDDLAALDSTTIMLSTCLQGATGPYSEYAGYGGQGGALAGIHYVTGWPDRAPAGPKGAYTDTIAPRYAVALIVGALMYRERTGQGQHIDLAQVETGLQFLAPELLDYSVNGRIAERRGNRSRDNAPCGAYPCLGDDRWVTIEVSDDLEWERLVKAMGSPSWAVADKWTSVLSRLGSQDELDKSLANWTCSFEPYELFDLLQQNDVASGVVQKGSDLFADPQLEARCHFVPLVHVEMGECLYNGPAAQLSKTPARLKSPAPLLGEHTRHVLTTHLSYTDARVDELIESGLLQ